MLVGWVTLAAMNQRKLVAWIDRELSLPGSGSYLAAVVVVPGAALIAAFGLPPSTLLLTTAWTGGWLGLVGWRIVVLSRRADREYDRRGKFKLAKDYRKSESASAASERRKRIRDKRGADDVAVPRPPPSPG